jgi:hypothetical protein
MPKTRGAKITTQRMTWLAVGCVWLPGIVAGLAMLARHDAAAGVNTQAPPRWPQTSRIPLSKNGQTLLMFAHPRCPCTRASIGELAEMLARCPATLTAHVVFFTPVAATDEWTQTDQWKTASNIPRVHVMCDPDGFEARLFHAVTSGHTLVYNAAGDLQFSGGITIARGHSGDNKGRSAIESLVTHSIPEVRSTPVYGCSIVAPNNPTEYHVE